jgi:hypothetical protein
MDRQLAHATGMGTWYLVVVSLKERGLLEPQEWGMRVPYEFRDPAVRDRLLDSIRATAMDGATMSARDAVVITAMESCMILDEVWSRRRDRRRALECAAAVLSAAQPSELLDTLRQITDATVELAHGAANFFDVERTAITALGRRPRR